MTESLLGTVEVMLRGLALPGVLPVIATFLGLIVGSFLNTVIHRLPQMLEREWHAQCEELAGRVTQPARFNLLVPRSRCPKCETTIRAQHLVPVLSWLVLRGRCAACGTQISPRYPLVELGTAMMFVAAAWRFGATLEWVAACVVLGFLIALALIDLDTHYLPDQLTLPLLWLGLAASLAGDTAAAVWGAIIGYLSLWLVYQVFRLATGKEGMGHGDFKLLAALGAWLGPAALLPIVLLSSFAGAAVGLVLIFFFGRERHEPLAFGPYLAVAGVIVMLCGETLPGEFVFASGR